MCIEKGLVKVAMLLRLEPTVSWAEGPTSSRVLKAEAVLLQAAELVGGASRLGSVARSRADAMVGEKAKLLATPIAKFEGPNLGLGRVRRASEERPRPGWLRLTRT